VSLIKQIEIELKSLAGVDGIWPVVEVSFSVVAWNEIDDIALWDLSSDRPVAFLALSREDQKRVMDKCLDVAHDAQGELADAEAEKE
jgi:hypothetical protein